MNQMKRVSRWMTLVLALLLLTVGTAAGAQQEPAQSDNLQQLPIVDQKLTLSCWVELGAKQQTVMNSWDAILGFKEIEERTNIAIEWMHPPVGGEMEQLNTMIAARNLPDIIHTNWDAIAGGPGKMINDEIIIDIDPMVQTMAPNLLAYWAENPELRPLTYTDEKQCFGMPYYWPQAPGYLYHFGFVIRDDWAKALNVAQPTDVESWHTFLVAVRDGDPNGNGKQDELPFAGKNPGGMLDDIMQLQRLYGIQPNQFFYVEADGSLASAIHQPEMKEWLATMAQWYAERLIDPDILSTDRAALDNKVLTDTVGAYWSGAGTGQLGLYLKQKQNQGDTAFSLQPIPFPTTAKGERLGWLKTMPGFASGITTSNKHPEETVRYFDYYFSREGHLLSQLGPEGKVEFTDYCTNNPDGLSFDSAMIQCGLGPMSFTGYQLADYWKYNISFTPQAASSDAIWGDYTVNKELAGVRFTTGEASTVASITNEIRTLYQETVSKIIIGQKSVDDFDTFVRQAEGMGIEELFEIYKVAYERMQLR
ncbi:MAG TPA: hypothetical protein PKE04_00335 [Clostridia bacterium]|nr:hypothetical protein [Clostridia bacterium]